jgi:hypothetical protein
MESDKTKKSKFFFTMKVPKNYKSLSESTLEWRNNLFKQYKANDIQNAIPATRKSWRSILEVIGWIFGIIGAIATVAALLYEIYK